jgi:hypothetical protein
MRDERVSSVMEAGAELGARVGVWEVLSVYTFCVFLIYYFNDTGSGKKPSLISPVTGEAPVKILPCMI